jgi:hypothetical protein
MTVTSPTPPMVEQPQTDAMYCQPMHFHSSLYLGPSGLDKGTFAAALIRLGRAGQRQLDRGTAYRPPPMSSPLLRSRVCAEAGWLNATGRTDDHRGDDGLSGKDGGRSRSARSSCH